MKTVVVVPTYNEAENIAILLPRILQQDPSIEVLVVDDNSPDGTGKMVDLLAAVEPRIHILHRLRKEGLGPSYVAGFRWALEHGAQRIIQMDADFSHDPLQLREFLIALQEADVVIGSRYIEGGSTQKWSIWRKLISRAGTLSSQALLGMNLHDITGGFKCFRREVLERIDLTHISSKGYAFQIEVTYRALQAGFRVKEIPITFVDRLHGQSKMNGGIALEAILLLWKLRFGRTPSPYRTTPSNKNFDGIMSHQSTWERQHTGHKILMVVSEAPPTTSGVGKVIGELKQGLEAKGHLVDILSSTDIPRYNLGEFRLSTFVFHWWKYRNVLDHYDLINIHAPAPTFTDLFLLFASNFGFSARKNRLVLTYHCEIDLPGAILQPATRLYSWLHKRLAKLAGHTIVTTPSYATMFAGVIPSKQLSVIPWGVDACALSSSTTEKHRSAFHIAFVGQMRPYKGVDILLRAMAELPGSQLTVVGSGHHAQEYQRLAEHLRLSNISFRGRLCDREMQEVLQNSHALVLPSRTRAEAFGIVLLEGMAAGCVPIASELPGVCDVVGDVGFTFPVGDHEALAALLMHLQNNPEFVRKQAQLAQTNARFYTWQRCVDSHDRLFRSLMAQELLEPAYKFHPQMDLTTPVMVQIQTNTQFYRER